MLVLGIETSCDETAAAVVEADPAAGVPVGRIRSNVIYAQLGEHRPFGGVVPEIAARAHLERIDGMVARALADAGVTFADLDGVAATAGPGLIGGVIVGVMTAKAIALAHQKPFIAVNHLEGHALTTRLIEPVAFPFLLLLVSGGHCQLLAVDGVGRYTRLGTTIDDAVGEAFDKTAKLLGLGFPGGPAVERAARDGDPARFDLPRPLWRKPGCDFSFSGLKTAVRLAAAGLPADDPRAVADLAASFQRTVGDILVDRCRNAFAIFRDSRPSSRDAPVTLVVAGGVAANQHLRLRLTDLAITHGARLVAPPPALCTDNAAMIAWAGIERLRLGLTDGLDVAPRPRWPLDPTARAAIGRSGVGSGVKV
ncbi:tRNA (adenosine(37)-N6)-threonylcarbamoyltransferase complex transferase subunit TsaD [Reyranella sp. CPCC 100927]|uniref:tRNA (adenosine(37)-N6)-threonylcarbamoyltransferase complex transferase subunit TsaD n=1 Tax=Reyranella sp. CPCC 100927 TaxID=2599616 RepID=UPI0011B72A41|nr:tRNA (adenosine(37)-N6)-threonylcarbamoyltransferase complex transferase subunit TsaD [Reyranella sp. CPCC 100927]TWT14912.1 tRNA (adenosine(37)-N6)-threonylcarbamoyltransferase complex transferase subunit TsaD [Reyranella sp. CPCC 100927]